MIPLTPATRVFLAAGNTDLRKSFERLADLVAHSLKEDPLSGHLYIFANRRWPRSGPAPREKIPGLFPFGMSDQEEPETGRVSRGAEPEKGRRRSKMKTDALLFPSAAGPALARLRVRISPAFSLSGCPAKRNQKGEGFHAERGQRKAGVDQE